MTESPAFTPIPLRARHDGWTPERQRGFLDALARLGLVAPAAKAVGMSAKSAYRLRDRPGAGDFAAAWDAAVRAGGEQALDTAIGRALDGTVTPVFYRGRQVGEVRRFDERLLLAALRRLPLPPGTVPADPMRSGADVG